MNVPETGATATEEQPREVEMTIDLNELDEKINEMVLSIQPQKQFSPEVEALMEQRIDPPFEKTAEALDIELRLCALQETEKMYPIEGLLPLKLISRGDWIIYRKLPPFSDDVTKCVHHAITFSYVNMQIAAFMGFDEVFLLGFDHQFPQQWKISPDVLKNPEKYVNATRGGRLEVFERVNFDKLMSPATGLL